MFYEYLEVHGEWYYFYKGKKVVDVVPHGIGTLLDLIHHFISRELSQGQNSAYLYTHLCYTFISLISTPIITEGIVQYMLCVKSLQTCFLISHKYFPNKPMSNHLYLWSTLSIELANSQYIFFTYLHTFWFKENRGGGAASCLVTKHQTSIWYSHSVSTLLLVYAEGLLPTLPPSTGVSGCGYLCSSNPPLHRGAKTD